MGYAFIENQLGEIDALMLDSKTTGLRVVINDPSGFRGMFDANGCAYENDDADELFGDERDIATLVEMFSDRVIKPGDNDAIKRFLQE